MLFSNAYMYMAADADAGARRTIHPSIQESLHSQQHQWHQLQWQQKWVPHFSLTTKRGCYVRWYLRSEADGRNRGGSFLLCFCSAVASIAKFVRENIEVYIVNLITTDQDFNNFPKQPHATVIIDIKKSRSLRFAMNVFSTHQLYRNSFLSR